MKVTTRIKIQKYVQTKYPYLIAQTVSDTKSVTLKINVYTELQPTVEALKPGDTVDVSLWISGKEYNGNWFMNLNLNSLSTLDETKTVQRAREMVKTFDPEDKFDFEITGIEKEIQDQQVKKMVAPTNGKADDDEVIDDLPF